MAGQYHATMELFVVRHAKAEPRDVERWPDDALRPLTREGAKSFERMARALGAWRPDVDLVLSSGWTRAWDTARILRARAGWPKPVQTKLLESSDTSTVPELVAMAAEQPSDARLAMVGHDPCVAALVSRLAGDGACRITMRKGAVAWLRGRPGSMRLEGLLLPSMLRRP